MVCVAFWMLSNAEVSCVKKMRNWICQKKLAKKYGVCLTLCCWNSWHSYRTVRELGGEGGGWEKMMLNKGIKSLFFTSMLEMFLYWKKTPPHSAFLWKLKTHPFLRGQVTMSALEIMYQFWGLGSGVYQRHVSQQISFTVKIFSFLEWKTTSVIL